MKILSFPSAPDEEQTLVLIFGLGLIGQSILNGLRMLRPLHEQAMPYDWQDNMRRTTNSAAILKELQAHTSRHVTRLVLVWAGGRNGFGSDLQAMDEEYDLLDKVLALFSEVYRLFPHAHASVHLISSAGGLFEGLTQCGYDTQPQPLRPYGVGKLKQESLVRSLSNEMAGYIYRPSSVYGYAVGGRAGLITSLIGNAIRHKTTRIYGHCNTLRDYVLVDDIGRFVAHKILFPPQPTLGPFLLAQGRPASMYEVIGIVERALQTNLLLQFDPHPSNARDIGFLPSALPQGWHPTELSEGVSYVATKLKQNWLVSPGAALS